MQEEGRPDDLEILEDIAFQQRTWFVERCGWLVLAALVAAAVLGLFGSGLLGTASVATDDGRLSVEFYRFWRRSSPTSLRLRIEPAGDEERTARVWLDSGYLDSMSVASITPEPAEVEASTRRVVYVFALAESGEPVSVTFRLEPLEPWFANGRAGLAGGQEVVFRQFVYP